MNEQQISHLKSIYQKINNPRISLKDIKKICEKEDLATFNLRLLREDKEEGALQTQIIELASQKIKDYFDEKYGHKKVSELLSEKITQFTNQEIDLIEWMIDGLLIKCLKSIVSIWGSLNDDEKKELDEAFSLGYYHASGEILDQNVVEEKSKKIKESLEQIQREKSRRQQTKKQEENQRDSIFSSPDSLNFSNNNNSSNLHSLHQEIKNLQNQLNNLQTQPTTDNFQELKKIKQAFNQLQSNLQNIEQKKKMDNSFTSHQEKQELVKLKTELTKLQNQLKQNKTNQPQQQNPQSPNRFN